MVGGWAGWEAIDKDTAWFVRGMTRLSEALAAKATVADQYDGSGLAKTPTNAPDHQSCAKLL